MRALSSALLILAAAACAGPAAAAERTIGLGTFERLRVEGPFEVAVATGSPGARVTGDREAIAAIAFAADGATLVVRASPGGWGERPRTPATEPVRIMLSSPALRAIMSQGGARLTVAPLKARRIELTVGGSGAIALAGADADDLNASVVGAGTMTLAGRTARARMLVSGAGGIDAGALEAGELTVATDSTGETRAHARYVARVANTGVGRITVAGTPKCDVRPPNGNVACGSPR